MQRAKNLLSEIQQELSNSSQKMMDYTMGSIVKNTDHSCAYYGSIGTVEGVDTFPEPEGKVVAYRTLNSGKNWTVGQLLKKQQKHLALATDFSNDDSRNTEYNNLPILAEDNGDEYLNMVLSALKAISVHAKTIYNGIDDPHIIENLTEPWVLGKLAVISEQMRSIRDFVVFSGDHGESESSKKEINEASSGKPMNSIVQTSPNHTDDLNQNHNEERGVNNPVETEIAKKPGLWDNIRKKKERMGKNYKPAKPGDKDRPDPEQWKKLTK